MKFDFFTLGGRFFWEDIFYYQGWRIQRKIHTSKFRLLDSHNIRRESGNFEICKDTLLKYISACEIPEPKKDMIILIHGFGRTGNALSSVFSAIRKTDADCVAINYCSFSANLQHNAELLLQFLKNFPNSPNLYFITVGAGCLVLRKMFDVCDNYRTLKIQGVININPMNSGSDFAFLLSRFAIFRKILGPMIKDITPDETLKISKIPQDISLYLIFSPSKISAMIKKIFAPLESFPQLSPPAENTYSPFSKEIKPLTWLPLQNENMLISCVESLEELMQNK